MGFRLYSVYHDTRPSKPIVTSILLSSIHPALNVYMKDIQPSAVYGVFAPVCKIMEQL